MGIRHWFDFKFGNRLKIKDPFWHWMSLVYQPSGNPQFLNFLSHMNTKNALFRVKALQLSLLWDSFSGSILFDFMSLYVNLYGLLHHLRRWGEIICMWQIEKLYSKCSGHGILNSIAMDLLIWSTLKWIQCFSEDKNCHTHWMQLHPSYL